jgi:S1-C subfamily serine protease
MEAVLSNQSPPDPLLALSDRVADTVARVAPSIVVVEAPRRAGQSGFVWRPGVVVTAEEALEADDGISVILPDGQRVDATLVGRDPSTDVAVLRIAATGVPALALNAGVAPRAGELTLAVGRRREGPTANLGIVSVVGGPWRSLRGGQIERFIRLDLSLDRRSEGGVVLNAAGEATGMAVCGARRSVLSIPAATIERVAEQLLARGRIARGYLGLGLQPIRIDEALARSLSLSEPRGVIVISVDPQGPGHRSGVLLGDVVTAWNGEPVRGLREILQKLGPDAVGQTAELAILRAGKAATASVTVGERPAS